MGGRLKASTQAHRQPEMHRLEGVHIVTATPKALLVAVKDFPETWLPVSQCKNVVYSNDREYDGALSITVWLAKQKGFIT